MRKSQSRRPQLRYAMTLTLLCLVACKPFDPFVFSPVTGVITIDQHEKEITFEKPFQPRKHANDMCFVYVDNLEVIEITKPPIFSDGTPLIITSRLVDGNGSNYDLTQSSWNTESYSCFQAPSYSAWSDIPRKELAFVKLFVKSNREINLSKIEWKSYDPWDFK